jgi:hypothetical protein
LTRARNAGFGMLGLGVGYFVWYTPYSGLAKAMSAGLLPMTNGPVGGLVLLPAAALGTCVGMPLTLTILRWWHYARRLRLGRVSLPFPGRETAVSAFWMALIVGTTTLNLTFPGVSILLVLVLMRIGTLVLSPSVDLQRHRKIHWYSSVAVLALAPGLGGRVHRLDGHDVAEPEGADYASYVDCARRLQVLVRRRVGELGPQRDPVVVSGG